MTYVVLLLIGVALPAALYGISVLLDRRTVRRGGRRWRGRREVRLLDEARRRRSPHPKDSAP